VPRRASESGSPPVREYRRAQRGDPPGASGRVKGDWGISLGRSSNCAIPAECVTPDLGGSTFKGMSAPSKLLICKGLNRPTHLDHKGLSGSGARITFQSPPSIRSRPQFWKTLIARSGYLTSYRPKSKLPWLRSASCRLRHHANTGPGSGWKTRNRNGRKKSREQLFVAIQDGDLHAKGRLSTTRSGKKLG